MKSRFTIILLLVFFSSLNARHIIGGTVAYRVSSPGASWSVVSVEFTIFRNAKSGFANFDSNANFGIYGVKNNNYTYLATASNSPSNIESLDFDHPEFCPELQYEKAIYSFGASLPNDSYDYYVISHQRCCRDNSIWNIVNPETSGIALTLTIYPKAFEYTEKAIEIPTSSLPFLLNSMEEHELDLSFEDAFTKEYTLTIPSAAGGIAGVNFGDPEACDGITPNPTNCTPPYGNVQYRFPNYPYGVESEVSLDQENGEFKVDIPTVGITLFELTIDRFDNEEILSSINCQWTTTTSTCEEVLSTNENSSNEKIILAPNPTSDNLYTSELLSDIVIYDALGSRVLRMEKMENNMEISISKLNSGLYFLKGIKQNGDIVNLQFVKS